MTDNYATADDVNELIAKFGATTAPHLVPIWRRVRDAGLCYQHIVQGDKRPFWPPPEITRSSPQLVLLDDDCETSKGPIAFHQRSLKRLFKECSHVTLIATASREEPYASAAERALLCPTKPSVLVECLPQTQDTWIRYAKKYGVPEDEFSILMLYGHPSMELDCDDADMIAPPPPKPTVN